MTFRDMTLRRWESNVQIGLWYDRKNAVLEAYLDDAMRALALGVVDIKRRLAEEAEKQRLKQEALRVGNWNRRASPEPQSAKTIS